MHRPLLAAVLLCWLPTSACAYYLNHQIELAEADVPTFDLVTFNTGPEIDVWHVVVTNPNASNVTSMSLNFPGPWVNLSSQNFTFNNGASLPVLGPFRIAETFFVVPDSVGPSEVLSAGTVDDDALLAANYTVAGDISLIDANGGDSVIAVLSTIAGQFDARSMRSLSSRFSGGGFINGAFAEICFACPEPCGAGLVAVALLSGTVRNRRVGAV